MMNTSDPSAVLQAAYLETLEDQVLYDESPDKEQSLQELPGLTLGDVADTIRRVRWHQTVQGDISDEADRAIDVLKRQIAEVEAYRDAKLADRDQRIAFHESRLQAFYRLNPPTKSKTLRLFGIAMSESNQQPAWTFPSDVELIAAVKSVRPELIGSKQVETISRTTLKEAVLVQDGIAYLYIGEGELHPLPVTVADRPPKFKIDWDPK